MSTENVEVPKPIIRFWECPASGAPEVKGYTCYFNPTLLEWSVAPHRVAVTAHGPATRVSGRQGRLAYTVHGYRADDEDALPDWITYPTEKIGAALHAFATLNEQEEA